MDSIDLPVPFTDRHDRIRSCCKIPRRSTGYNLTYFFKSFNPIKSKAIMLPPRMYTSFQVRRILSSH